MSDTLTLLLTVLSAFALGCYLNYMLIPALRRLKVGQEIREIGPNWHASKAGTPTMGGLAFIGASGLCLLFGIRYMVKGDFSALCVLALALSFGLIGFLDDFFKVKYHRNLGLTAIQKSLLQMAASVVFLYIMYRTGFVTCELYIPFVDAHIALHPVLYFAFGVFVIVGSVNAVNLTDGLDGLATSVTIPVMVFFTATAALSGKANLALFPAALLGGLCAFLIWNFYPAKVFMGDTGSLFLGGAVCGVAFGVNMPLVLILVGLIYIIETVSVILQVGYFKATHGKRLFKMAPIHHHFEKCGWTEVKIVLTFAGITWALCILAFLGIRGTL